MAKKKLERICDGIDPISHNPPNYYLIPNALSDYPYASGNDLKVALILYIRKEFLTHKELSAQTGITRRTLKQCVARLRKIGMIHQKSDELAYQFNFDFWSNAHE